MHQAIFLLCLVAFSQGQDEVTQTLDEQTLKELDYQLTLAETSSQFENLWTETTPDQYKLVTRGFYGNTFTGWQLAGNKNGKYFSQCGVRGLVGGYDILGANAQARVIEDLLPVHNYLLFELRLFKIDEWGGATIAISVDGKYVWQQQWQANTGQGNLCGNQGKIDGEFPVKIEVAHTAPSVTITIVTNMVKDASLASWGFREYRLSYK